jgi:cysteine-rich repeat protein
MQFRVTSCLAVSVLFTIALLGCGGSDGDDKDGKETDGGTKEETIQCGQDGGNQTAQGDGATSATSSDGSCGNRVVDANEECDDGNLDNGDGCNAACKHECKENANCDDGNPCNGAETCSDHKCRTADKPADEGTSCGTGKYCSKGICSQNTCGDKLVSGDEQCDDGNLNAADGCTPACKWTCEKDADCAGAAGGCSGGQTCNVEHKCTAGVPVADRTDCSGGWCIGGACIPKGCGNGTVEAPEECDIGADNGKAGAGCNGVCKVMKCGNSYLESGEECDDGNVLRLDGCDPNCKIEFAHRWTRMHIVKGPAPDYCVHKSNRFGDAYPAESQTVTVAGYSMTINALQMFNESIDVGISSGEVNSLVHVYESTDTSMQTTDPEIQIGIYDAIPAKDWISGPPIDFPFNVLPEWIDENRLPKYPISAEQAGGGRVVSKAPSHLIWKGQTSKYELFDAMLSYAYDVSKLSAPQTLKKYPISDQVKLPEAMGAGSGDPTAQTYNPSGIMCGAMTVASQKARLVSDDLASICCKSDNTQYRSCSDGKTPPNCDTYADILKGGCTTVCFENMNIFSTAMPTCQAGCGTTVIVPIEPDVDTDKDGVNDAYSSVIAFEGKRVRIADIAEE